MHIKFNRCSSCCCWISYGIRHLFNTKFSCNKPNFLTFITQHSVNFEQHCIIEDFSPNWSPNLESFTLLSCILIPPDMNSEQLVQSCKNLNSRFGRIYRFRVWEIKITCYICAACIYIYIYINHETVKNQDAVFSKFHKIFTPRTTLFIAFLFFLIVERVLDSGRASKRSSN